MSAFKSDAKPSGRLSVRIIRAPRERRAPLAWKIRHFSRPVILWGWIAYHAAIAFSRVFKVPTLTTRLSVKKICADGTIIDYGVTNYGRVITDDGMEFVVDAWQNGVELENMKYHGLGEDSTAEAVTQAALVAELSTEYTGNVRATGTTEETSAKVFKTIATNTLDDSGVIEEFGLFSQAATGGGVMFERALTGTQTLASGDGLQTTYEVTFNSGG